MDTFIRGFFGKITLIESMTVLICITVPIIIGFMLIIIVYFKVFDKPKKVNKGCKKHMSTSRQLMKLFFILFSIILLSLVVQFSTAYIIMYNQMGSIQSYGIMNNTYTPIPFDIIINAITACTILFSGAEMVMSSTSSIHKELGSSTKLPENKRIRVSAIVYLWLYVSMVGVFYHFLLGTDIIDFQLKNLFVGLSSACAIMFGANKAHGVFENISVVKEDCDDDDVEK